MENNANGRVSIKEVYELVADVRTELSTKMDNICHEVKELNHENSVRDLKIQALELEFKSLDVARKAAIEAAFDKHLEEDHKGFSVTTTKVWVMWGVGIFIAVSAAGFFIEGYIAKLLGL